MWFAVVRLESVCVVNVWICLSFYLRTLRFNAMVRAAQEGRLDGCEVFFYTDNQIVEGVYSKGTAGSQSLFELIVML
jgi:hypothetical protein